jgi:hypothetical protein
MERDIREHGHNTEPDYEEDSFDTLSFRSGGDYDQRSSNLYQQSSNIGPAENWRISCGFLPQLGSGSFFYDDPTLAQESPVLGSLHRSTTRGQSTGINIGELSQLSPSPHIYTNKEVESTYSNSHFLDEWRSPSDEFREHQPKTTRDNGHSSVPVSGQAHGNNKAAVLNGFERFGRDPNQAKGSWNNKSPTPSAKTHATGTIYTLTPTKSNPFNDESTSSTTSLFPKIQAEPKRTMYSNPPSYSSSKPTPSMRTQGRANEKPLSLPRNTEDSIELSVNPQKYGHNNGDFSASSSVHGSDRSIPTPFVPGQSQTPFSYASEASTARSFIDSEKASLEVASRGLPSLNAKYAVGDSEKHSVASSLSGRQQPDIAQVFREYEAPTSLGPRGKYRFKSYQLEGKFEQPWREDPRMKRTQYNNWIVWFLIMVGVIVSAYICFSATKTVSKHQVGHIPSLTLHLLKDLHR